MSNTPKVTLHQGDCFDVLKTLPDNSIDSIVTDPPYGLSNQSTQDVRDCLTAWLAGVPYAPAKRGFMGKDWDGWVPGPEVWRECLRVLKPGGVIAAFAGTRTQHLMALSIQLAGLEVRDLVAWLYGSGFPKSLNLDGAHEGWGTALKPAFEPITLARKPLSERTVAANVARWRTGALNIDGCRVAFASTSDKAAAAAAQRASQDQNAGRNAYGQFDNGAATIAPYIDGLDRGRWPANVAHDGSPEVTGLMPETTSGKPCGTRKAAHHFGSSERGTDVTGFGDSGSAARFFYCAKASRRDREEGCEANAHPTVKPTPLIRWLARLITPPGGAVLDPYMGSGSHGKAAVLEGFSFVGIERSPEYLAIAAARIQNAQNGQTDLFA
jgi:site-specific DNA-methyltransferase (adenine-specific)